jgi:phosphatidylinositol alpha-mannosyltransferase
VRVALVAPYDLAAPGGVQGQVLGLARALAERGDTVLVLGPGRPRQWAGDLGALARSVVLVGVGPSRRVRANGSDAPICISPLAAVRTRTALDVFAPEVVHIHEPFVPGPALAAARSAAAPIVATFHRFGASIPYRLAGPLLLPVARRAALLVAVSQAALGTLEAVIGSEARRALVLANGVDVARFSARRKPAHHAKVATIVFVGRLEPRKGVQVLLDAVNRLRTPARLVVVGDGPLRQRVERLTVAGVVEVTLAGRLSDEELARVVAEADILVAPSLKGESFGVVLLEAMAAGTAVVASDLPGYRMAAGDAARFTPPGDVATLAAVLEELLADDAARHELCERGRRRAARHSFSALAAAYHERYELVTRGEDAGAIDSLG